MQARMQACSLSSPIAEALKHLPPVQYAFAYGSGVLHQPGLYASTAAEQSGATRPMTDYILAVEDPLAWHTQNINTNTDHYSWVAKLGPAAVTNIAEHVGVGVHFNALVHLKGGQIIKYGVISTKALLDDLRSWRHLYVAGRLHKPVLPLVSRVPELDSAQQANLQSAAATALLLLPPKFTTQELLSKIITLSYTGDVRMGIAEDPQKINRILQGSRLALEAMYLPLISRQHAEMQEQSAQPQADSSEKESVPSPSHSSSNTPSREASSHSASSSSSKAGSSACVLEDLLQIRAVSGLEQQAHKGGSTAGSEGAGSQIQWERHPGVEAQGELFKLLPPALLTRVAYKLGFEVPESHLHRGDADQTHDTLSDVASSAMRSGPSGVQQLVAQCMADTVRRSSASQAVSGFLAAGGGKAVQYVVAKMGKALQGAQLSVAGSLKKRSQ